MRKIYWVLFIILVTVFSFSWDVSASDCNYNDKDSISWNLIECFSDSDLVGWDWNNAKISDSKWFSDTIRRWIKNISVLLAACAVFWIVYGSFNLVISQWESEKATNAKNIIQWSIIWFICIITASVIINLTIKIIYSI
jgi:hypothetical protein